MLSSLLLGYSRAKLANILFTQELQTRSDANAMKKNNRMLLSYSLHPGVVSTNLASILSHKLVKLILRSSYEAAYVALYAILSDNIMPGSYINSMQQPRDFQDFKNRYLEKHLKAYPYAKSYSYALNSSSLSSTTTSSSTTLLSFSLDNIPILFDTNSNSNSVTNVSDIASRLYDVTENIISNFERYNNDNNIAYITNDNNTT